MIEAVLGIDGGATRTRAVLTRLDGTFMGYGQGGSSNYDDVGIETTSQNIANAINQAIHQGSIVNPAIKSIFLGMAGVVSQADRDVILGITSKMPLLKDATHQVDHDLRIALSGGLLGKPGIVLIVGTGCSCFGINHQGVAVRVGGWGHLLDDIGSSYYLGLQALIATIRAEDGRIPPTLLTEKILLRLEIQNVQNILWRVYHVGLQPAEIASIAPLVIEAAESGDEASQNIIHNGVQELAFMAQTAGKQLGYISGSLEAQQNLNVVLIGGLVKSSHLYRETLTNTIQKNIPGVNVKSPELPPVFGAVLLAMQSIDILPIDPTIKNLKNGVNLVTSAGGSL